MAALPVHEPDDPARAPVLAALLGALIMCIALACAAALFLHLRQPSGARAERNLGAVAAGAQVSTLNMDEFRRSGEGDRMRQRQADALRHYAWVDRERGLVRIPIDVAIALELQEAGR